jgi:hypothetical protein
MKNSAPKRRRGRVVDEIAVCANVTTYKARQAAEIAKYAPNLLDCIINGEGSLADAIFLIRQFRPIKRRARRTHISVSNST